MRRPTSAFFPSLSLFDAKGVALFFGILSFYRTHSDNEKTKRKEEVNEPSEHGWSLSLPAQVLGILIDSQQQQ
jgi:hypothetical protein